jgi:hypothetical protein
MSKSETSLGLPRLFVAAIFCSDDVHSIEVAFPPGRPQQESN